MAETRRIGREELKLTVSVRALKELGLVYGNRLDAIRELIQNALDAGATSINIVYDKERRQLVFEHNGEPIEGEYLDAFLTVGTDFKARKGGYIGQFGIGRLSWLMLGHTAEIITGKHRLVWRETALDVIERESIPDYYKGVKWIIHLRDDIELSEYEIVSYIEENYHGEVPIYVNGKRVRTALAEGEVLFRDSFNEVVYNPKISSGHIVKGVFTVGTDFELRKLVIRTNDPRVRINPARGLVWDEKYREWRRNIARKVLEVLHSKYTPSELYRKVDEFTLMSYVEVAFPVSIFDSETKIRRVYRERINYLVFKTADGGYVRGADLDPKRWVFSELEVSDTTVQKLLRRGIRIIYVSNTKVKDWLKSIGFRDIREVAIEEEAERVLAGDLEKKLNEVYREIKSIVRENVTRKSFFAPATIMNVDGKPHVVSIEEKADAVEIKIVPQAHGAVEYPAKINVVRVRVVGRLEDIDVVFVDHPDRNVVAFTNGERIFININNPRVKEIVAKTRRIRSKWKLLLLWAPILVHEMIHMYGYDHTDPEWHQIYEDILMKINERVIEELSRSRR